MGERCDARVVRGMSTVEQSRVIIFAFGGVRRQLVQIGWAPVMPAAGDGNTDR